MSKRCPKCEEEKPVEEFSPRRKGGQLRQPYCKPCSRSVNRDNYRRNGNNWVETRKRYEKTGKGKSRHYKHKYGINEKEYRDLVDLFGGQCGICGKTEKEEGKRLSVDHCHTTGEVRGILCMDCNVSLGRMKEDPSLLREMIRYINKDDPK